MVMYLGDVYQRGMPDEFVNFYNPIYGADAGKTIPTIGNHEYKQLTDGAGYFWYWNFPNGSPTKTGGGGSWYSLNAPGLAPHQPEQQRRHEPEPTDTAGVVAEAGSGRRPGRPAQGEHPCTLAFWHAPRFSDISLRKPSTSPFGTSSTPTARTSSSTLTPTCTSAGSRSTTPAR